MVFCSQCCSRQADDECTRRPPYCASCCRYWAGAKSPCALQHHQPQPHRQRQPRQQQPAARKLNLRRAKAGKKKKAEAEQKEEEKNKEKETAEDDDDDDEQEEEEEEEEQEEEEEEEDVDIGTGKLNTASASSSSSSSTARSSFPASSSAPPSSVRTPVVAELVGAFGPVLRDIQRTVHSIAQHVPASDTPFASAAAASSSGSVGRLLLARMPPLAEVKSMHQLLRAMATLLRRTLLAHRGDDRLVLAVHGFIVRSLLFAHCTSVSAAVRYISACDQAALQAPALYDPTQGEVYLSAYQSIIRPRLSPAASASLSELLLTADDSDGFDDDRDADAAGSKRRRTVAY